MTVLNVVLPVFLVIGLGWGLRRGGFLADDANAVLTRLVFHVAAPVLLLRSAAATPLSHSLQPQVLAVMVGASLGTAVAVYAIVFRSRPARRGVIAQGAHRGNLVFMGLPLVYNAWGAEAVGQVAVLVGLMVIVYNMLAVLVLTLPHRRRGADPVAAWLDTGRRIATNPLALGSLGGIILSALDVTLPKALGDALDLVGRTALPLALVSVGAGLDFRRLRSEWPVTAAAALVKLGVYPALVWLGLSLAGLDGLALKAPVLLAATPTAVVSYVMAREMDGDGQLAGAIVIGTTLAALPTTVVWLLILGV